MTDRYTWHDVKALGVSIHWDAHFRRQIVRHETPEVTKEIVAIEVTLRVEAIRAAPMPLDWPAFECGRCGEPVDYQITLCGLCALARERLTDERWASEAALPVAAVAILSVGKQATLLGIGSVAKERKKVPR